MSFLGFVIIPPMTSTWFAYASITDPIYVEHGGLNLFPVYLLMIAALSLIFLVSRS